MGCVLAAFAAVLENLDLVWGVKLVFLGDVVEAATNRAF